LWDTLNLFAKAHGMELDAYLDAVANSINNIPEEFALPANEEHFLNRDSKVYRA